jgi:hypothetical protein
MNVSQQILNKMERLPPDKQQEVLDFADFLHQRLSGGAGSDLSVGSYHPELAELGDELAAEVWPQEDFSDWEEQESRENGSEQ